MVIFRVLNPHRNCDFHMGFGEYLPRHGYNNERGNAPRFNVHASGLPRIGMVRRVNTPAVGELFSERLLLLLLLIQGLHYFFAHGV